MRKLPEVSDAAIVLSGSIDRFIPPRLLTGWVRNNLLVGGGRDITICIYRDGRLIAEGRPTRSRPDIVNDPDYLSEFGLFCTEDVPDEAVAFERLRIEARDAAGRTCNLPIWDRVRETAVENLFRSIASFGKPVAAAILRGLGESQSLTREAREAIMEVHDLYFAEEYRRLMYLFEGLGKDCSLGNVQRAYGAEPIGLLRFAGLGVEAVTKAILGRFEGVGSPEFTKLIPSATGEYYSSDSRYHMSSHTFVFEGEVEFEHFYKQQCRKISFLVRNIIEKLEDGDKIFVIHAIPDIIDDGKLRDLLAAIRSIGPARLLYLVLPNDENPSGSLTMRDDGIMVGHVLQIQGDLTRPIAEVRESWLSVLRKAEAAVLAIRQGGVEPKAGGQA